MHVEAFKLHEKIAGKSERTIKVRVSRVSLLARWLTDPNSGLNITLPADVRRVHLHAYIVGAIDASKFSGVLSVSTDLRTWWNWYATEARWTTPWPGFRARQASGSPRPRFNAHAAGRMPIRSTSATASPLSDPAAVRTSSTATPRVSGEYGASSGDST
jgi:hypothetical protein